MIEINLQLLNTLTLAAQQSERLRTNYDLRNSDQDTSQRMLNAIEPGSIIPIHRHTDTSETVIILRGSIVEIFYDCDHDGSFIQKESYILSTTNGNFGIQIPKNQWHTVHSLESGTIIIEMKNGKYKPN